MLRNFKNIIHLLFYLDFYVTFWFTNYIAAHPGAQTCDYPRNKLSIITMN